MGLKLTVGQAAHMKNVPGRKTDMNDSQWIAHLHRFGLIKPSLIPDSAFQKIRLLTRHRENLVGDKTRVKNRIQKTLEDGNIKWGSIVSDVFGVAGMCILRAIAKGETNPGDPELLVKTNIKNKGLAMKALSNCLTGQHVFLLKSLMEQYDQLERQIAEMEEGLAELFKPYAHLLEKLDEIPGVDITLAQSILAETTDDMKNFRDERAFAAWSGVASGNNESAGKKKRSKCRKGNPYLRKALIQAAHGAVKKKKSFYKNKYNKLKFRLGSKNKAKVAVANRIARAIYKILSGENYRELGYKRAEGKERKIKTLLSQLKSLGVAVRHEAHETIVSESMTVSSSGLSTT